MRRNNSLSWIGVRDQNFMVEASAGTGKTHSLLERIIRLISQDPDLRLRQLVAITFTEKASAELRTRLRKRLAEERAKFPESTSNPFARALSEFEQAEISTIHSFCARLLRLRPVEAKVAPGFEVIEPEALDLVFEQTWEDWLGEKAQASPQFFSLLRTTGIGTDKLKGLARELYQDRDLFYASLEGWKRLKGQISVKQAELRFYQLWKRTKAEAPKAKVFNRLMDHLKNLLEEAGENKARIFYQFADKELKRGRYPKATEINAELIKILDRFRSQVLAEFLEQIADFFQKLEEEKKAREVLDFEDLLFKTRDLLQKNKEVRAYFKQRYKYILVDEFQDTDPVQVEMVFFLAEELNSEAEDWREVKLHPGKLFLVGDPKQSIYRFRRADLKIYQKAKEVLCRDGGGAQPVLRENRRSHPGILEWVNHNFEARFENQAQEFGESSQPRYQGIVPHPELKKRTLDERLPNPVVFLELESSEEKILTEGIRKLEAQAVADFIEWAISSELKIWDKAQQDSRTVCYRDFAVLYPTHKSVQLVKSEFQKRGIPFQITESEDFVLREEISGLISILKVLLNPLDSLALVSGLRSLFFGVSDQELFEFKCSGGDWNWLELDPGTIKIPALADAYRFLRELFEQRERSSVVWLMERLIEKSQVRKLRRLNPRFNQVLLNLERLKAIARSLEQRADFSLADFVDWLEMRGRGEGGWPELFADDPENAVIFSTIHKAKGLEFPIVILINLCGKQYYGERMVLKDWGNSKLEVSLGNYQTPGYFELAEKEKVEKRCEYLREFYVATTRAQQYLVLPDFRMLAPASSNQYIDFVLEGMPLAEESHPLQKHIHRLRMSALKKKTFYAPVNQLSDFLSETPKDTELEKEKEDFAKEHWEKMVRARSYKELIAPSKEEEGEFLGIEAEFKRRRALDLGALIHQVIERAGREKLEVGLELARRLAQEQGLEQSWEELEDLINAFWKSDLKKEIDSLLSFQEVPFLLEAEGKIYRGRIDLILRKEKGLYLIDFKTDRIGPEQIPEQNKKYERQLEIYQRVLKNLRKEELLTSEIFYLQPKIRSEV